MALFLRSDRAPVTLIALCGLAIGCTHRGAPPQAAAENGATVAATAETDEAPALFRLYEPPQPLLFDAPDNVRPVALFSPPPVGNSSSDDAEGETPQQLDTPANLRDQSRPIRLPPLRLPPPPADAAAAEPAQLPPDAMNEAGVSILAPSPEETLLAEQESDKAPLDSTNRTQPHSKELARLPAVEQHAAASPAKELRRLPPVDATSSRDSAREELASDESSTTIIKETSPAVSRYEPRAGGARQNSAFEPQDVAAAPAAEQAFDASPEEESIEESADGAFIAAPSTPSAERVAPQKSLALDPAMSAVTSRANQFSRRGALLAERGAYFSARAEFVQALTVIAQALDAAEQSRRHSEALSAALRALKEVDDFAPRGGRLEADLNLPSIIAGHRTPVLKDGETDVTPLAARQRYYDYAQQQLTLACENIPSASLALFGLGKLHSSLAAQSAQDEQLENPKALVMHQAALDVDERNHLSANEVGVLLAKYGAMAEARGALVHSLTVEPTAAAWRNLAVVHQRMGELELAQQAKGEWARLVEGRGDNPLASQAPAVQWVDKGDFERASPLPPAQATTPLSPQRRAAGAAPQKRSAAQVSPWSPR